MQHAASLVGGAALIALGLKRRTLGGAVVGLAGAELVYRGATGYCHLLGALGIETAQDESRSRVPSDAVEIQRSITIQRPRQEVYDRWRDAQNQPLLWSHCAEIVNTDEHGARWRVDAPLGHTLEWETRIIEERAGELIRWRSTRGQLPNEGTVEFRNAPGDFGTEVTVRVRFDPPGRPLGDAAARLLDDPPKLVLAKALRRFKSLVETGEIASTDRNPSARAD